MNTKYNYTNAYNLAQDISVNIDNLKDLVYIFWEFSDEERRGLAENKHTTVFLSRYHLQEALQDAISTSVDNIAQNIEDLVEMLMKLDRQTEKEE